MHRNAAPGRSTAQNPAGQQAGNGIQTFGDKEGMERNTVSAPAEKPAVIKTDD